MKFLRVLAITAVMIGGCIFLAWIKHPKPVQEMLVFSNLLGPREKSVLPANQAADWRRYEKGSDSRLVILLTKTDSNWLGLAHGLKSAGIPFSITTDYARAIKHKVVIVYPMLAGSVLSEKAIEALTGFAKGGGTLVSFDVLGGGVQDIFGFGEAVPFKARYWLNFTHPPNDADGLEKKIPIDNLQNPDEAMGVYTYTKPVETPIAIYEDGGAAITQHKIGRGRAIAFGFDLGALLFKGYENRQENMARSYDNGFEPALDVLLRLIEDIYRAGDNRAVVMRPVPDGKKLATIFTHDIDYTRSLTNALNYARFEHDNGIRATYFMQTKYIRDYNDEVILTADSPDYLKQLHGLGMELASHTVSHSYVFRQFPMGDGKEHYPDYHPFVVDRMNASGGTILGELRVSRFLIEQLVPGVRVNSFRPGYLSDPYGLPEALVATGYRYSSSVTANDSLTHLPFQLTYSRDNTGEVPVYEFPVTIADGPPDLTGRLRQSIALAKKIARKGGLCVVLIHPDVVEPKLGFEKQFAAGIKSFSWFGTMKDFGRWWEARDIVQIDSRQEGGKLILHIDAPLAVERLTLVPPAGMHPVAGQARVKAADEKWIILDKLAGPVDIALER